VPAGAKLLEIDSRGRRASWAGIDERGRLISDAVVEAVSSHKPRAPAAAAHPLHLVK